MIFARKWIWSLIKEEKQGFGKSNLIYIGKIEHAKLQKEHISTENYIEADNEQADNRTKEDSHMRGNTINDTELLRANKKDNIKHKNSNIDVSQSKTDNENLECIKQNCELYLFDERQRNIIENALDIMFYSKELKIGQAVLPRENVRSRMQILNASIIFYAFDKLNNLKPNAQIYNSTNFMISCLYNAITEYYSDSELQFKIDYGSG